MRFRLIDQSTANGNDPKYGGPILPAIAKAGCEVLTVFASRDVGSEWGGSHIITCDSTVDVSMIPGEVPIYIVDSLPNAPGDVAYHDDAGGVPIIFIAREDCNSIGDGSDSIFSALSHEIAEAIVDPYCNEFIDNGRGQEWAKEACDVTQEDGYTINGIHVTNFVRTNFFGIASQPPYDYLNLISSPFTLRNGGYSIIRTTGTAETQIYGDMKAHRARKKFHWSSRTSRRLGHLKEAKEAMQKMLADKGNGK